MTIAAPRRLPGFAFEAEVPVYDDVLPRMDVAVFAGFAASGPMNVPVPVEDPARFAQVFGADAPLAWDEDLGGVTYAQLGPAVRAFFANGGRRCWVVRLAADTAADNVFPVPGVAVYDPESRELVPLELRARSPGSWSDSVRVSASLTTQRFAVEEWGKGGYVLTGPGDAPLQRGDLLHVAWDGVEGYVGIDSVTSVPDGSRRIRQTITFSSAAWFKVERDAGKTDETISRTLDVAPRDAPQPGEVFVIPDGGEQLVLVIHEVALSEAVDYMLSSPSRPTRDVIVRGKGLQRLSAMPESSPPEVPAVNRIGLDVWARVGNGNPQRVGDLGLAPSSAKPIWMLPDDTAVYDAAGSLDGVLWRDAISPRFPLAGQGAEGNKRVCIPFGVGAIPERYLGPRPSAATALERDGLDNFSASLFADESLAGSLSTTLLADAEYEKDAGPLRGIHSALSIEEATLIAVPDAVQRGWLVMEATDVVQPEANPVKAPDPCPKDDFIDCDAVLGDAPVFLDPPDNTDGNIYLAWTADETAGAESYVVEEASSRDWRDAAVAFAGDARETMLTGRRPGDYYYRVRRVLPRATDWSKGVTVRVNAAQGWRVKRPNEYSDDVLVAVHRLLLRFCAARRDAMAVLSVPEHYDENAASAHARLLLSPTARFVPVGKRDVAPIGYGEADALSFGALYHGWLYTGDDRAAPRTVSPDGFACGVIAKRGNNRGAWVAPANELLRGVIALHRPAPRSRWAEIQQLNINLLRRDPRGFIVMSADTLSPDAELRPINVRRLLILLRRLAMRWGTRYVFEPNNASFRRMVQRGFEELLGNLFQRGAFAGSTPSTAFQVVAGESLNTQRAFDEGRFIVELRVAPSRPMVFLTLRLVQTGERLTVTGG